MKFYIITLLQLILLACNSFQKQSSLLKKEKETSLKLKEKSNLRQDSHFQISELKEIYMNYFEMKKEFNHILKQLDDSIEIISADQIEENILTPKPGLDEKRKDKLVEIEKNAAINLKKTHELLENFVKVIDGKMINLEKFLKNKKKKNKHYDNSLLFYNSLSLIMLALLTGGLVGVIFILYYSFKTPEKPNF